MDQLVYILASIILAVLLLISEILGSGPTFDANSITTLASSFISSSSSSSSSSSFASSSSSPSSPNSSSSDDIPLGVVVVSK
jgi:hypothetical protein